MCSTAVEFHAAFVRVHSLVFCGKYRNIQKCNWSKCLKFLLDYRFASAIYLFSRNVATESNLEWNRWKLWKTTISQQWGIIWKECTSNSVNTFSLSERTSGKVRQAIGSIQNEKDSWIDILELTVYLFPISQLGFGSGQQSNTTTFKFISARARFAMANTTTMMSRIVFITLFAVKCTRNKSNCLLSASWTTLGHFDCVRQVK